MNSTIVTTTATLPAGQPGTQQGSIFLKIQFNEDIRRVSIPQLSFGLLTQRVSEAFKIHPTSRVVLKYQDDEGDLVTVGSLEDLEDAQRLATQRKAMLRLNVSTKKKCNNSSSIQQQPEGSPATPALSPSSSSASPSPSSSAPIDKAEECKANDFKEKRKALKEQHKLVKEEKKKLRREAKEALKLAKCEGKMHCKREKEALKQCWQDLSPEERAAKREAWRKMSEEERAAIRVSRQEARRQHHQHADAVPSNDPSTAERKRWRDMSEEERAAIRAHRAARREARQKGDGDASSERRCWRHLTPEERIAKRAAFQEARRQRGEGCRNNRIARFVKHVTVPDGTTFEPDQTFVKTWRIRNEGPNEWTNCKLVFVSRQNGDLLGAPEEVIVPTVASGQEIDISVNMIAPKLPGRYVGFWRLANAEGRKFGQRIWVKIDVVCSSSSSCSSSSEDEKDASSSSSSPYLQLEDEVERSFFEIPSPSSPSPSASIEKKNNKKNKKNRPTFAESLKKLKDLGFTDVVKNIHLLKQHDGDVNKVIADLLA